MWRRLAPGTAGAGKRACSREVKEGGALGRANGNQDEACTQSWHMLRQQNNNNAAQWQMDCSCPTHYGRNASNTRQGTT